MVLLPIVIHDLPPHGAGWEPGGGAGGERSAEGQDRGTQRGVQQDRTRGLQGAYSVAEPVWFFAGSGFLSAPAPIKE